MKRSLIVYSVIAALLGASTGAMHQLLWKSSFHYLDIACVFIVFPILFIYMGLTERHRRTIAIVGVVMMLAYFYAWQTLYSVMQGRLRVHNQLILFLPLMITVYISIALLVHLLRKKINRRIGT